MTELRPGRTPVHPGQILRGELIGRGMKQFELAEAMGRPPQMLSEIINGKKWITADTAIDLEQALGIEAGFWLRVQAVYELAEARRRRSDAPTVRTSSPSPRPRRS